MYHTHYHQKTKKWFSLETCEKCNCVVMAANAVTLMNPEAVSNLIYWDDDLPSELGYDESVDMAVCDDCYDWEANA